MIELRASCINDRILRISVSCVLTLLLDITCIVQMSKFLSLWITGSLPSHRTRVTNQQPSCLYGQSGANSEINAYVTNDQYILRGIVCLSVCLVPEITQDFNLQLKFLPAHDKWSCIALPSSGIYIENTFKYCTCLQTYL